MKPEKLLEEAMARAAIAAIDGSARQYADLMDKAGPGFVLMGATAEQIEEWKSAIKYLREKCE